MRDDTDLPNTRIFQEAGQAQRGLRVDGEVCPTFLADGGGVGRNRLTPSAGLHDDLLDIVRLDSRSVWSGCR